MGKSIKFKKEHLDSYVELMMDKINEIECTIVNENLIPFIEETLIPNGYNDKNNYTLDLDGINEFFIAARKHLIKYQKGESNGR